MTHLPRALLLAGLFLAALLSGCQSTPTPKTSGGLLQESHLYRAENWQAEGKISIQMASDRQSASFKWNQAKESYEIHLFGPFGQGATWLRRTGREVTLENVKTGQHKAASAEALMQEVLGWQVPVTNLQFWLRGMPAKKLRPQNLERDPAGFLTHLHQEGWQVDYSRHQDFNGWWLPTRILAARNDLRLTIVIKSWQLPDAPANLH
jgi:outer membrane lipoprotein LolB